MRYLRARTIAILAAAIPSVGYAQVLFHENFDDGLAGTRWHLTHGADNGLSDYAVSYGFNYGLLGIPNPIGGLSTTGAALDTNTTATSGSQAEGINIYPNGTSFAGDFTLRCWVWCQTAGSASTTNEEAMFGMNASGTHANWDSFIGSSDGLWTGMVFNGANPPASHRDYARYHGSGSDPDITGLYDNLDPVPQRIFRNASGTPANQWSMLEARQVEGRYRVKVNGKSLDLFGATAPFFGSGDLFLGHQDITNDVNVNTFSIFDEVSVRSVERWKITTGGNWSNALNWGNGVAPDATDRVAYFGPIITAPSTIILDGSRTVGAVIFDSSQSYTIAATPTTSTINMQSAGPFAEIDAELGTHAINARVNVAVKTRINVAEGATLTIGGIVFGLSGPELRKRDRGTLVLSNSNDLFLGPIVIEEGEIMIRNENSLGDAVNATQVLNEGRLTIDGSGGDVFTGEPVVITGTGPDGNGALVSRSANNHVGSLTVSGAARVLVEDKSLVTAFVDAGPSDALTKSGAGLFKTQHYRIGTLEILQGTAAGSEFRRADNTSRLSHLIINPSAALDLAANDLIYDYDIEPNSPLADVRAKLAGGFNSGLWSGFGINSSNAFAIAISADPHKTALGYAEARKIGQTVSFDGLPIDDSTVLIRYTWSGDANLDGLVNALDFNALASNFGGSDQFWFNGEFNYDGVINTLDFNALASNFNQSPLASPALGDLIPEPCTILLPLLCLRHRFRSRPKSR